MGSSPDTPHKITYAVKAGRHVFCVRVMSGSGGWVSALRTEAWSFELPDLLRMARLAQGSTYNPTPLFAAAVIYFLLMWPLVRLLSRFESRILVSRA